MGVLVLAVEDRAFPIMFEHNWYIAERIIGTLKHN